MSNSEKDIFYGKQFDRKMASLQEAKAKTLSGDIEERMRKKKQKNESYGESGEGKEREGNMYRMSHAYTSQILK